MAVPRNRHSNARKNSRRAHHARKPRDVAACEACGAMKLPHRVCEGCGDYRGRNVVAQKATEE